MSPLAEKYAKAGFTKEEAAGLELAWESLHKNLARDAEDLDPLTRDRVVRLARAKIVEHLEAIREVRAITRFEE